MESKVFDPSLMENRFRHEFKYLSTLGQLKTIQVRLTGLIPLDPHVGPDGIYNIRSLYFDDYEDRYLKENEAGVDPREKFRIRIYNHSDSRISLELKRKVREKTQKLSCPITKEQCEMLMRGEIPDIGKDAPPVLQKLCLLMRTRLLRPKVIVDMTECLIFTHRVMCGSRWMRISDHRQGSSCFWKIRFRPDDPAGGTAYSGSKV